MKIEFEEDVLPLGINCVPFLRDDEYIWLGLRPSLQRGTEHLKVNITLKLQLVDHNNFWKRTTTSNTRQVLYLLKTFGLEL